MIFDELGADHPERVDALHDRDRLAAALDRHAEHRVRAVLHAVVHAAEEALVLVPRPVHSWRRIEKKQYVSYTMVFRVFYAVRRVF